MNKTIKYCGILLVAVFVTTIGIFIYGGETIIESILSATLILLPMIFSFGVFYLLSKTGSRFLISASLGVFITNLLISGVLALAFTVDVLGKGGLGPAQGYWLMFTWAGGAKLSMFGIIGGVIFELIRGIRKQAVNK